MADLSGKVALVMGAGEGTGRGIAEGLAEAGGTIYVTGAVESFAEPPTEGSIEATCERVRTLGGRAVPVRLDHHDTSELGALCERVRDEQGRLDVLVNNGPWIEATSGIEFWAEPLSVWDQECAGVLQGYYAASVYAAAIMVPAGRGLIVQLCSETGPGSPLARRLASAAVESLARCMAVDLRPRGVTTLCLQPDPSPRFTGRSIAALAMDPDVIEKSGGTYRVAKLAREYRFTDPAS